MTRLIAFAAAAFLAVTPADAQERYRVLVPDLYAANGARRNFGEDVAKQLRTLLNGLRTHQPIDIDDLEDALDEYDMQMRDLDCLKTQQLATSVNANIALCARYTESGETREITGIQFWDMQNQEALDVANVTATGRAGIQEAAQHIFKAFDNMVALSRAQQFCAEYALSQQWDNALTNCTQALELNPGAIATRLRKARIHFEQARAEGLPEADKRAFFTQSIEELNRILAINEFHEDALQLAGFVSVQLGDQEAGRRYYYKYLEVNPGDDNIRLNIAYDMAQAGDPEAAMGLVKQGIDAAPENAALLATYANYAFRAAQLAQQKAQAADGGVPAAAQTHYRDAIATLNKLRAMQGAETTPQQLNMLVGSHLQLGEFADAERVAKEILATTPNDAITLSFLADAQYKQGRIDDAVATVSRIRAADAAARAGNVEIRQGNWLLEAGRLQDALAFFRQAVERGEDPNQVSRLVFGDAVNKGVRADNWAYAITGLVAAKTFAINADTRADYDFWHGFSVYNQGMAAAKPQTLESARASLPIFENARTLLTAGRAGAGRSGVNVQQLLDAINQYIEIQNVIIRRYGE